VLLLSLLYGLLPSVALASSGGANQSYNGYKEGGYPAHTCATYVYVHHGDTLSRIAARNGVSVYAIAQANDIPNIHRIYPGQHICIPFPHKAHQPYAGDKHYDRYKMYGEHANKWDCGCPGDYHGDYHDGKDYSYADNQYPSPQEYMPGYYESTGGHTGVRYYPDPRYNSAGASYYQVAKGQGHYRTYP